MRFHRALFLAACVLPMSLIACGGDSENDGDGNIPGLTPTGEHHGYVVSKATAVPNNMTSATELGLDLGSETSAKLDGKVDNRLGTALGGLAGIFDIQTAVNTAISHGTLLLLVDLQTTSFDENVDGAGLSVKFGATATPAPCTDANDATCGHHLNGDATFTIDPASPNAALVGQVANKVFKSNSGDISLKLTLGTDEPIQLDLHHARARATDMSASKLTLVVGGLMTSADIKTKIGPVIKAQVDEIIAANCTGSGAGCGCTGNTAITAQKLLDTNGDCAVTLDELFATPTVAQFLKADSCSQDTCAAADSVSLGIKVEAVKATF